MKKTIALFFFILFSCLLFAEGSSEEVINNEETEGIPVSIIITAGPGWEHTFKMGRVTIRSTPQIAVWLETPEGNYIDTLFITERFGEQNWRMIPDQKKNETYRIETVPYWMHKLIAAGISTPTEDEPFSDTVTGASPESGLTIQTNISPERNEICVLLELNLSYDGNENFPNDEPPDSDKYNAVSGQPAVVYKTVIRLDLPGTYEMLPAGYSHPAGLDGSLTEDLSVLTSALKIVANAKVIVGQ